MFSLFIFALNFSSYSTRLPSVNFKEVKFFSFKYVPIVALKFCISCVASSAAFSCNCFCSFVSTNFLQRAPMSDKPSPSRSFNF